MASIRMVVAVRRDDMGDVTHVQWGICDTVTNAWEQEPSEAEVIDVVDALMSRDKVSCLRPSGGLGPELKVVAAKRGHGRETIECNATDFTVADLPQF